MTITTSHSTTQTYTDGDGREFDLPVTGEIDNLRASDVGDGKMLISYLVLDDEFRGEIEPFDTCDPWMSTKGESWDMPHYAGDRKGGAEFDVLSCTDCGYDYDHTDAAQREYYQREYHLGEGEEHEFAPIELRKRLDAGRTFLIMGDSHGPMSNYWASNDLDDAPRACGWFTFDDGWTARTTEELRELADSMMGTVTSWANGDIWGVVHQVYYDSGDGWVPFEGEEACWGYVGHKWALEELSAAHENWSV